MSTLKITKDNFDQEVLKAEKPVLLDFWAVWCGPCQMLSPIVEQIADEQEGVKVGSVNVDEEGELAAAFRVDSIPALFVVKNGTVSASMVGYRPKEEVESWLKDAAGLD